MKKILSTLIVVCISQFVFGQNFIPRSADTLALKSELREIDYIESITYLYLKANYLIVSEKDSVEYFSWDPNDICAFTQFFERGVFYKVWECKEAGGISETIQFPKMDLAVAKDFVETLYYHRWNSWKDDYNYKPDGVGCYYKIIESDNHTTIEIYCGC